ncbi:MAG: stage II sporulation protein M, partial [Halobaculum sp.]
TTRHDSSSGAPTVYKRDRGPLVDSLRALFVGGTRQFGQFAVTHPLSVFLSTVAFVAGTLGGWRLTAPAGVRVPPPTDVARVFGTVPVNDFLNIAANNWLVAVSGVYSGLAFGLPAAVGGAFNGALVGALAGAFDLRALAVLVAPHGVIEIPTLLVAWGVGIHLGGVGWRAVRGRTDAATVAERLQTAAHALAGVAVLLVVASFVEAFLTPQIAAFVLG